MTDQRIYHRIATLITTSATEAEEWQRSAVAFGLVFESSHDGAVYRMTVAAEVQYEDEAPEMKPEPPTETVH
jgi:hypothetical protein